MPTRRRLLQRLAMLPLALASAPLLAVGVSQSLGEMDRYVQAVLALFSRTSRRIDELDVAPLDTDARAHLASDLADLRHALDRLLPIKGVFVSDLRIYLKMARASRFDSEAQRRTSWQAVQRQVDEIVSTAISVQDIISRPDSALHYAIPAADMIQLSNVMAQRGLTMRRFEVMSPPRTPGELAQLDAMLERQDELLLVTEKFRESLETKRHALG